MKLIEKKNRKEKYNGPKNRLHKGWVRRTPGDVRTGKIFSRKQLEKPLRELIKVRASQINSCAYCIDMHWKDARAGGETEQRLYGLQRGAKGLITANASGRRWHGRKS